MRNASVTLTINLNMEVPEIMAKDKIEGSAYWLIKTFLDDFDGEINGCKVLKNSINIEGEFSSVDVFVTNEVAERMEMADDKQGHGGIAYIGETLDHFIQEERNNFKDYGKEDENDNFVYSIPLGLINGTLNECGIEMFTPDSVWSAQGQIKENKC